MNNTTHLSKRSQLERKLVGWLEKKYEWRKYLFMKWYCNHYFHLRCAEVGEGLTLLTPVMKPVFIGEGKVRLGSDVIINGKVEFIAFSGIFPETEISVGDRTMIGNDVTIRAWKSIRIGSDCLIARHVQIYDNNGHPLSPLGRMKRSQVPSNEINGVVIGNNVWIAENAHIQDGVTVGDNSIIAPYSIVTKDVPPNVVVMGTPAKVCNWLYKLFPGDYREETNVQGAKEYIFDNSSSETDIHARG